MTENENVDPADDMYSIDTKRITVEIITYIYFKIKSNEINNAFYAYA